MPKDKTESHKLVIQAAKHEFLSHGYEKASMRNIANKAGLTVGALYKHFTNKEEMFSALIDPVYKELIQFYKNQTDKAKDILASKGIGAFEATSAQSTHLFLKFIYKHFDEFQLMFHAPPGSRYANIREQLVQMEMASAKIHEEIARTSGLHTTKVSEKVMHVFFTMSLTPLFEIVEHGYTYEEAVEIVDLIAEAQNYAWTHLIELNRSRV